MSAPFLVCDFDGTVCREDVGDRFFQHFVPAARHAEWEELISAYDSGRIGSRECLTRECEMIRVTPAQVRDFAAGFEIEPSFRGLWDAARAHGAALVVVSDGLDIYIRAILDRAGLPEVPVLANHAAFEGDVLRPEYPWAGRGCGRCGNCKGHHVETARRSGHAPVVMIGDAHSDVCGAIAADRVFARATLARLLDARGVPCERLRDFGDVRRGLAWNGNDGGAA